MKLLLAMAIILPVLSGSQPYHYDEVAETAPAYNFIKDIPLPAGFRRIPFHEDSFSTWLRNRTLKRSNTVYLYNGMPKRNQAAQYAVLDISVGEQDLQQCADAVMRLRAEYLYEYRRWSDIVFKDNASHVYRYKNGKDRVICLHRIFIY